MRGRQVLRAVGSRPMSGTLVSSVGALGHLPTVTRLA
jgi:hypothetical protein